MNKDNNKNEMDHKISPHPYKGNKGYNFFYVVESRYASYQRYVSVTKRQAFKGRCYHIIIVPPNGVKNLVVLVDSVFQKQLLYEAEELAEPTRAHLWNRGSEIRSNLCTVVSYETHCYI